MTIIPINIFVEGKKIHFKTDLILDNMIKWNDALFRLGLDGKMHILEGVNTNERKYISTRIYDDIKLKMAAVKAEEQEAKLGLK